MVSQFKAPNHFDAERTQLTRKVTIPTETARIQKKHTHMLTYDFLTLEWCLYVLVDPFLTQHSEFLPASHVSGHSGEHLQQLNNILPLCGYGVTLSYAAFGR